MSRNPGFRGGAGTHGLCRCGGDDTRRGALRGTSAVVHRLGGLFIAAHVERPSFSLISQLGFIDPSLPLDAIEFKDAARYERLLAAHAYLKHYTIYSASDAHDPGQIGTKYSLLRADVLDFEHLAMAFRKENGHTIVTA